MSGLAIGRPMKRFIHWTKSFRLLWDLGDHDLVTEFRVARRKIAAKLA